MYFQLPFIDPVIISIYRDFKVRYYGVFYIFATLFVFFYSRFLIKKFNLNIKTTILCDITTHGLYGVIIGGRLGNFLLYDICTIFSDPLKIFRIYEGGMSFHGGLIGVIISIYFVSKQYKINFYLITDIISSSIGMGIFFVRIANFINQELVGRITNVPWGVIFWGDTVPRHPSQIYEAISEGLLIFIVLNYLIFFKKYIFRRKLISSIFLILYAITRFIMEFFREIEHYENFSQNIITIGQLYSIPMLIIGLIIFIKNYQKSLNYDT